jgi:hypothetical protein
MVTTMTRQGEPNITFEEPTGQASRQALTEALVEMPWVFEIVGKMDGFPPGSAHHFLRKWLVESA